MALRHLCVLWGGGGGGFSPNAQVAEGGRPPPPLPVVVLEDYFKGVGSLNLAIGVGTAITIFHAIKHFN